MNDKTRNQPQTAQGRYLRDMAQGGHFAQKLGETSLALTEAYCKADISNRTRLGSLLAAEVCTVLSEVYGWTDESASEAQDAIVRSFQHAEKKRVAR